MKNNRKSWVESKGPRAEGHSMRNHSTRRRMETRKEKKLSKAPRTRGPGSMLQRTWGVRKSTQQSAGPREAGGMGNPSPLPSSDKEMRRCSLKGARMPCPGLI